MQSRFEYTNAKDLKEDVKEYPGISVYTHTHIYIYALHSGHSFLRKLDAVKASHIPPHYC